MEWSDNVSVVQTLIEHGACVKSLISRSADVTQLLCSHVAPAKRAVLATDALIDAMSSCRDYCDLSQLAAVARTLCTAGADVNASTIDTVGSHDEWGNLPSPLVAAVFRSEPGLVELFCAHGGDAARTIEVLPHKTLNYYRNQPPWLPFLAQRIAALHAAGSAPLSVLGLAKHMRKMADFPEAAERAQQILAMLSAAA